ncbi:protein of unknown function [Xenorhabdus doucetiae]|uniref:Uncharacterized protein n=1 Tax=Xenorhabdus doucetiae TaxID=351671 RepID=A0A068QT56_9GAMM|nr:protein of unknown function [Xenorhabdus doucetiae]
MKTKNQPDLVCYTRRTPKCIYYPPASRGDNKQLSFYELQLDVYRVYTCLMILCR